MILKNKAQASIEVMISILIVLFLFTIVFLVSIMKGGDITATADYLKHRESCIKLSSSLYLTSIFDYSNEIDLDYSFEISRDKGLLNVYKIFCYGYTKNLDRIFYQGDSGNFKISKINGEIKIDKL